MGYRLRDNLHWCGCGERVIFLDVEGDRYFGLPRAAEAAFLRVADGETLPADLALLRGLVGRGMLVEDPTGVALRPPVRVSPAGADLLEGGVEASGAGAVLRALAAEARASWRIRTMRLAAILKAVEARASRRRAPAPDAEARARRIAASFEATSVIVPKNGRCLVRGLALHAECARRDLPAQLVFGVRPEPFTAHCWVQLGDKVLIGDYEQVRLFTPILAL